MNWLESYYEALEFFYWEPQHLGRKKHEGSQLNSIQKVSKRLRAMEVTLNQNLHQFFLLAPRKLVETIFAAAFEENLWGPFILHGRNVDANFKLASAVQPDLLFTAERWLVSVEMKIDAKCSLSQVLKYALLGLAVELRFGHAMRHYLLLMGCGKFSNQWREAFNSIAEFRNALVSADLSAFIKRQPAHFQPHLDRFAKILQEMQFAFLNYESLASILMQAIPNEADSSDGAEVYRKLLRGVLDELSLRQLGVCWPDNTPAHERVL